MAFLDFLPLIGTAVQSVGNLFTNKQNNDNSREMLQAQQDYNTFMMENKYQMQSRDMAKSGMNPAFSEGAPQAPLGSAPAMSPIPMQNALQNADAIAQNIANIGLMHSQERKNNADADAQEIENQNQRERNKELASNEEGYFIDPDTGVRLSVDGVDAWITSHDGRFPDLFIPNSSGASGRFSAKRDLNQLKREVIETDVASVRAHLDKLVMNGQIKDPKILLALQNIPTETLNKLIADAKQAFAHASLMSAQKENEGKKGLILDSEKLMIDLDYQIKKDSNLTQYIEKIANGNFEVKDFFKMLVATLMQISMSATIGKRL